MVDSPDIWHTTVELVITLIVDTIREPVLCPVQKEVAEESKRVWKFIIDREIEAPDRFQAIQTYRCAHFHTDL